MFARFALAAVFALSLAACGGGGSGTDSNGGPVVTSPTCPVGQIGTPPNCVSPPPDPGDGTGTDTGSIGDPTSNWSLSKSLPENYKEYGSQIVSATDGHPVRSGENAIRFEVRAGDCGWGAGWSDCDNDRERHELSSHVHHSWAGGAEWYHWSIYLPADYPIIYPVKTALGQFHQHPGHVIWMFQNASGGYFVDNQTTGPTGEFPTTRILTDEEMRGKWSDILVHANWTSNRDGFFHVYVNGETTPRYSWNGPTKTSGQRVFFKFGIYRTFMSLRPGDEPTQIVYFDEVNRASTCADATKFFDCSVIEPRPKPDTGDGDADDRAESMDSDGDGVDDNVDFYPAHANVGLAAGDIEPRRYAAGEFMEELLANPRNTFRAYSATARRHYHQDGSPQYYRLSDRYKVVSVAGDGDFGFRITYRDEERDTPEKTVHFVKGDFRADYNYYSQAITEFDDASTYGWWSRSGTDFNGGNYGAHLRNVYSASGFVGRGFVSQVLYGLETLPTDLPTGTATYAGIIHAHHFDNDLVRSEVTFSTGSIRSSLTGSVNITADFAANVLAGRIDSMRIQRPGADYVDLPTTTGFDITAGNIEGSQHSATLTGFDTNADAPLSQSMRGFEGRLLGAFFGPEGERANSVFSASRDMDGGDAVITGSVFTIRQ